MVSPSRAEAWKSRGRGCWGDTHRMADQSPHSSTHLSAYPPPCTLPHLSPHQPYLTLTSLKSWLLRPGDLPHSSDQPQGHLPSPNSQNPHALHRSPGTWPRLLEMNPTFLV